MSRIIAPAEFARQAVETALVMARRHGHKDGKAFAVACLRSVGFSELAAKRAMKRAKKP